MTDTAAALDAYLVARFGITLERALADAAAGTASFSLRGAVVIACDRVALIAICMLTGGEIKCMSVQ